uniref:Ig-like domain-containing protein n=1 Tax=Gasterosteus aculeatus TaxID=69293 RepID=G3PVP2_GASAC
LILYLFHLLVSHPIEAAEVQQVSLMEAELGGNVTFQCPVSEKEKNILYWYKQPLGCTIQTVATRFFTKQTFRPQFNNSRFRVTQDSLTIMNISKEDEATYFCFTGSQFSHRFVDGTFLAVKDGSLQKSFHVEQSPEAESVLPGDSVTLQCSLVSRDKEDGVQCPHGHRVFWFRSGGSHPGLMYTQDTQPGNTSCVYRLAKRIRNSSDVGTYRCAVASCGQILFGGGTKVDTMTVKVTLNVAAVLIYVIKTTLIIIIITLTTVYYVSH